MRPSDPAAARVGFLPTSVAMWAMAGYIAIFIVRPWELLVPELATLHFERTYAILMIAILIVSGRAALRIDAQDAAVLLFVLSLAASSSMALRPDLAWPKLYTYTTIVIFYFALVGAIRSINDFTFVVSCYLFIMALYLGKAQWEYFVHDAGAWAMGVKRLQGIELTFGHPNSVAASAIYSLPVLLFLFAVKAHAFPSWSRLQHRLLSAAMAAYAVLAASSILLTRSRAGLIMLAAYAMLLTTRARNTGRRVVALVLVGTLCLGMYFVLPTDMRQRLRTLWDPASSTHGAWESALGRWEGYLAGQEMFLARPVSGVGIGNFIYYRMNYGDGVALNAHNIWGELMGETGVLGIGAWFLLLAIVLRNAARIRRATQDATAGPSVILYQWQRAGLESIALLMLAGMAGHNLLRFNWLWIAGFMSIAARFADSLVAPGENDVESTDFRDCSSQRSD